MTNAKVLKILMDKFTVEDQVKAIVLSEIEAGNYRFELNELMEHTIIDTAFKVWTTAQVSYVTPTGIGVAMQAFLEDIGWHLDKITPENFKEFYLNQEWR